MCVCVQVCTSMCVYVCMFDVHARTQQCAGGPRIFPLSQSRAASEESQSALGA